MMNFQKPIELTAYHLTIAPATSDWLDDPELVEKCRLTTPFGRGSENSR